MPPGTPRKSHLIDFTSHYLMSMCVGCLHCTSTQPIIKSESDELGSLFYLISKILFFTFILLFSSTTFKPHQIRWSSKKCGEYLSRKKERKRERERVDRAYWKKCFWGHFTFSFNTLRSLFLFLFFAFTIWYKSDLIVCSVRKSTSSSLQVLYVAL